MLLAVEEKLEGLKYNQDSATDTTLIWGDGVWVHRERDMTTLCKKGSFNINQVGLLLTPNIWENKSHVPNHQPDGISINIPPYIHF